MNVPQIIPANATAPASATAANAGAGEGDFASMLPAVPDDLPGVETADGSRTEVPFDAALAAAAEPAEPDSRSLGHIIQSLVADSKLQPKTAPPFGAALRVVGDIAATPSSPEAGADGDAPNAVGVANRSVVAGLAIEHSRAVTPAAARPAHPTKPAAADGAAAAESPAGLARRPISLAGVPAESTIVVTEGSADTPPIPGSTAFLDDEAPRNGHPAPVPVAPGPAVPLPAQASDSAELDFVAADFVPRATGTGQDGPGKHRATTGPAPGTTAKTDRPSTGAPAPNPSGPVGGPTADSKIAGADAGLEFASPAAGTPSDSPVAKLSPMASGATTAASQSGMINETAAAFGTDLRLGVDGIRPAAVDHAVRGQPPQPASEQIAVRISRAVQHNADRITIHLKPASLGRISVDLEIGPDNRLIAVIAADRPETLDLMQRDARALERALNDAGLKTDSGSLSFNLRGDGDGTNGKREDDDADWSSFAAPPDAGDATPMPVYARAPSAGGGIDIRV